MLKSGWGAAAICALCTTISSDPALALLIDTRQPGPPNVWNSSEAAYSGPDVAGGTFTATEDVLASFTLSLGVELGTQANDLRAVVLATDATGTPTGPVLWSGTSFEAIGTPVERGPFRPNLHLTLGKQCFIGVDSGYRTSAAGGDFTIQASTGAGGSDLLPGGQFWHNSNGSGWQTAAASEVMTVIELVPNPEPGTAVLLGLGLAVLGTKKRRHGLPAN